MSCLRRRGRPKDEETASLGYWVREPCRGFADERLGAVILPNEVDPSRAMAPMRLRLHRGWRGIVRAYLQPAVTPVAEVWEGELCL